MFKEVLRHTEGLETGGAIGIVIFFSFFVILLIYVWKMKKDYLDEMKNLPLDNKNHTK